MATPTASDGPIVTHTTITSTDDVMVAVHDFAAPEPAGPTVLAAHATGFHGMVWQPLAGALADRTSARVVAPDLRGHGATVLPGGVMLDWDGFADDILAVVDALGLQRPVGVGHSKGGAALLRAEARRPGTFAGLWCFEPVVFPPEFGRQRNDDNPLAAGALRRRDRFDSALDARANYGAKPPMAAFDPGFWTPTWPTDSNPSIPTIPPVRFDCAAGPRWKPRPTAWVRPTTPLSFSATSPARS